MPTITWTLEITDPNLRPIQSLTEAVDRLRASTGQAATGLQSTLNAAAQGASTLAQQNNQLAQSTDRASTAAKGASTAFGEFGARVTAIATGQAIYKGISDIEMLVSRLAQSVIELPAKFEQSQIAFKAMLGGNADAANTMLAQLQQIANMTPFKFSGEQDAARALLGLGEAASRILPMVVDIDTAVAAIGGGEEQVGRVTAALGKMDAEGRVSAIFMNELTRDGIPAWQMLAESMGLSVAQVRALSQTGDIAAATFDKAFHDYTVKHWGDALKEESQTFNGLISTASDLFEQFTRTFGMPIIQDLEPKLRGALAALQNPAVVATIHQWGVEAAKFLDSILQGAGQLAAVFGLQLPKVETPQFDLTNLGSWTTGLQTAATTVRDIDGETASLQARIANMREQQAGIDAGYEQQLTAIRGQQAAYDAGMDNRLAGLRDQARLLDQAYQSEKARRELANLGTDIARDRMLAVDIVSSQGQAAAKRLKDELARQADLQDQYRHDQAKNDLTNQEATLTNQKRVADQGYQARIRGIEAAKQADDQYFASLERGYQRQVTTLQTLKKQQADDDAARQAALDQWNANVTAATNEYRAAYDSTFQAVANGDGIQGPQQSLFDKLFGTKDQQAAAGGALGLNFAGGIGSVLFGGGGGRSLIGDMNAKLIAMLTGDPAAVAAADKRVQQDWGNIFNEIGKNAGSTLDIAFTNFNAKIEQWAGHTQTQPPPFIGPVRPSNVPSDTGGLLGPLGPSSPATKVLTGNYGGGGTGYNGPYNPNYTLPPSGSPSSDVNVHVTVSADQNGLMTATAKAVTGKRLAKVLGDYAGSGG